MLMQPYELRELLEDDGEGAGTIGPELAQLGLLLAKWSALSVT